MFDKTVINKWPSSVYSYPFVILAQGRKWIIQALAICFLYSAPAVATNRRTPGRSVSNHDNKGRPFRLALPSADIYCDNTAETPVKKAEGHKLHFCYCHPPYSIPSQFSNYMQGPWFLLVILTWQKNVPPFLIFLVLGSSFLYGNSPLNTKR